MDASSDQRRMVSDARSSRLDIEAELEWFAELLDKRLKFYFDVNDDDQSTGEFPSAPDLSVERGYIKTDYSRLVLSLDLGMEERLLLMLALIPFIRPQLLDVLWSKNNATERGFTEFGGISGRSHGGFLPTVETALFILSGDEMEQRLYIMRLLHNNSRLLKQGIVQVGAVQNNEPWSSGQLKISREFVDQLVYGTSYKPSFGVEFPARRIEIRLGWNDLVLPASMLEQLDEIRDWIQHGDTLLGDWGMRDKLAPGFTLSLIHI